MEKKYQELKIRLQEINDLNSANALLNWDQSTYMPPGGAAARGRQQATIGRIAHEKFVDPAIGKLLDKLEQDVAALKGMKAEHDKLRADRSWIRSKRSAIKDDLEAAIGAFALIPETQDIQARMDYAYKRAKKAYGKPEATESLVLLVEELAFQETGAA